MQARPSLPPSTRIKLASPTSTGNTCDSNRPMARGLRSVPANERWSWFWRAGGEAQTTYNLEGWWNTPPWRRSFEYVKDALSLKNLTTISPSVVVKKIERVFKPGLWHPSHSPLQGMKKGVKFPFFSDFQGCQRGLRFNSRLLFHC